MSWPPNPTWGLYLYRVRCKWPSRLVVQTTRPAKLSFKHRLQDKRSPETAGCDIHWKPLYMSTRTRAGRRAGGRQSQPALSEFPGLSGLSPERGARPGLNLEVPGPGAALVDHAIDRAGQPRHSPSRPAHAPRGFSWGPLNKGKTGHERGKYEATRPRQTHLAAT